MPIDTVSKLTVTMMTLITEPPLDTERTVIVRKNTHIQLWSNCHVYTQTKLLL